MNIICVHFGGELTRLVSAENILKYIDATKYRGHKNVGRLDGLSMEISTLEYVLAFIRPPSKVEKTKVLLH